MARFSPYPTEPERPLWLFIFIALLLFSLGLMLAGFYHGPEEPKTIEVELSDMQAVNEPPPLGDPEAGATPPPAPTPEPTPEQTPEPTPVPTPEMTPEPTPEFIKPDLTPPPTPPPPKPKPAPTAPPKPAPKPAPKLPAQNPRPAQAAQSTSSNPNAKVGVKGVSNGKAGARGGSKGDFIATPKAEYDSLSLQRRYHGTGSFSVAYANGVITGATVSKSTGNAYLDRRSISHIKSRFKVKPGASGQATQEIVWKLPAGM